MRSSGNGKRLSPWRARRRPPKWKTASEGLRWDNDFLFLPRTLKARSPPRGALKLARPRRVASCALTVLDASALDLPPALSKNPSAKTVLTWEEITPISPPRHLIHLVPSPPRPNPPLLPRRPLPHRQRQRPLLPLQRRRPLLRQSLLQEQSPLLKLRPQPLKALPAARRGLPASSHPPARLLPRAVLQESSRLPPARDPRLLPQPRCENRHLAAPLESPP
mmetsp:Transcript_62733/g.148563  ORF Transcript_62733/g.148563 Transcript_62733/m.148563 type:complete len:221 (-) Transcript_62733:270-932(-)